MARGLSNIKETMERQQEEMGKQNKSSYFRLPQIPFGKEGSYSLANDGDSLRLRFVSDGDKILGVNYHNFVPTRPNPDPERFKKWAKTANVVCGYDENFGYGSGCYVCDNGLVDSYNNPIRPRHTLVALVVVMEQWLDEEGGPIRDVDGNKVFLPRMVEKVDDETKETIEIPDFGFFSLLAQHIAPTLSTYYLDKETLSDRDYTIVREGSGTSTKYNVIAHDAVLVAGEDGKERKFAPGSDVWEGLITANVEKLGIDIEENLKRLGSEEYHASRIDPTKEFPNKKSDNASSNDASPSVKKAGDQGMVKKATAANSDAVAAAKLRVQQAMRGANR